MPIRSRQSLKLFPRELGFKKAVQETGEIIVKAFVLRDQLVGKRGSGNKPTLLEPEYYVDATGEEDSLDAGKGKKALRERFRCVDPLKRPLSLYATHGTISVRKKQDFLLMYVSRRRLYISK
ncbi:hypothetical protein HPP92_024429 [Vanilla planifolia]|uniref:Uncharacterized protein n=1 Tax=Vanilla planifolia TaxID=51239 RepID=A0A835UEN7_VANPL|nr:hypothetical protein HPP92_024741 [Vanilla planifolia]KAG0456641.1 hypothetical protein HPP92_024429 [Vanilla planifolia]